jgi:glycosyltransferase involved in cell wall biosynthesis
VLLVTPKLTGRDGISNVSRQVVDFIVRSSRYSPELRVWSLTDEVCSSGSIPIEGFSNAKLKLSARALTQGLVAANDLTVFILHLHLAPLALPIAARGGKLVIFLHGVESWRPLSLLQRIALRCSSFLIANSEYTKKRFVSLNPIFREQDIRVCHPGTNATPSAVAFDRRPVPFALIVGRVDARERYKGHDLLLATWPRLRSEVPDARLLVVGDGTDLSRLRSKAASLELGNAVEFVGRASDESLHAFYRDCAFFVMPSGSEGFGLVFLEAMRAGKPCIGAQGAAEEIIEHGVSGYVMNPSSPDELFDYMKALFLDSSLRTQMGGAGLQRFKSYFTVNHFQQRLLSALAHENQLCRNSLLSRV